VKRGRRGRGGNGKGGDKVTRSEVGGGGRGERDER